MYLLTSLIDLFLTLSIFYIFTKDKKDFFVFKFFRRLNTVGEADLLLKYSVRLLYYLSFPELALHYSHRENRDLIVFIFPFLRIVFSYLVSRYNSTRLAFIVTLFNFEFVYYYMKYFILDPHSHSFTAVILMISVATVSMWRSLIFKKDVLTREAI